MKRLWKVSLGKNGEFESNAIANSVITIDFSVNEDISNLKNRDQLIALMEKLHPEAKSKTRANFAAQINQFKNEMSVGDLVVCPFSTSKTISVGEVISECEQDEENLKPSRKVKWLKEELPRDAFKQDLLYSFGAIMTVCEVKRNNALARVENVISTGVDKGDGEKLELTNFHSELDPEENFDLQQIARDQIEKKIASNFTGHDFTRLVDAILIAEGYQTYVSPPGPDKGIDILAGSGPLGLESPRIVVQVKSGSIVVDQPTVQGLSGSIKDQNADFGLIVSWGGFTAPVRSRMSDLHFRIRFWDRTKLVDNLLEVYDKLPEDIQLELPLKRIWMSAENE